MIDVITLDWECYYDTHYSVRKMTTFEYIVDPRFSPHGVGVKINAGTTVWMEDHQFRVFARSLDWSKVAVLAHHTHFESLIMREHYGITGVAFWFDTLSMDRGLRSGQEHDLEHVAPHWCGRKKLEMPDWAKGLHRADMTAAQWDEMGVYCINDVDCTYDSFVPMLKGYPAKELRTIDLMIRMYCEPTLRIDESILAPYAVEEKQRRSDFLRTLAEHADQFTGTEGTKRSAGEKKIKKLLEAGQHDEAMKKILGSGDKFAALLRSLGIEPATKKTDSEKGWTYSFAKDDPFMQLLVEHEDETIADLAKARLDTKSTLNVTRPDRFLELGAGGRRAPVYIAYSKAHTHRPGGGDKANWLNLERVNEKKPRSGMIRRSIRAGEDECVVVCDSAQIECRGTFWLAEDDNMISAFRDGRDVYSEQASVYYGRKVDRKFKLPDGTKPDEIEGHVGKTCVLGLGYGMGWAKLAFELMKGANGGPPVIFTEQNCREMGVDFDRFNANPYNHTRISEIPTRRDYRTMMFHCAACWHLVNLFRSVNKPVPDLWTYAEDVIGYMAAGEVREVFRGTGQTFKNGIVSWSGLPMRYDGLRRRSKAEGGSWVYRDNEGYHHLYGGMMVENWVQHFCGVIVRDQMVQYANEGHRVAGFTYDEIIGVEPKVRAAAALARLMEIMKTEHPRCPGLPLDAEGGFATHYGDAK